MPSLSLFFTTFLWLLKFWPLLELLLDNHPKIKKKNIICPRKIYYLSPQLLTTKMNIIKCHIMSSFQAIFLCADTVQAQ